MHRPMTTAGIKNTYFPKRDLPCTQIGHQLSPRAQRKISIYSNNAGPWIDDDDDDDDNNDGSTPLGNFQGWWKQKISYSICWQCWWQCPTRKPLLTLVTALRAGCNGPATRSGQEPGQNRTEQANDLIQRVTHDNGFVYPCSYAMGGNTWSILLMTKKECISLFLTLGLMNTAVTEEKGRKGGRKKEMRKSEEILFKKTKTSITSTIGLVVDAIPSPLPYPPGFSIFMKHVTVIATEITVWLPWPHTSCDLDPGVSVFSPSLRLYFPLTQDKDRAEDLPAPLNPGAPAHIHNEWDDSWSRKRSIVLEGSAQLSGKNTNKRFCKEWLEACWGWGGGEATEEIYKSRQLKNHTHHETPTKTEWTNPLFPLKTNLQEFQNPFKTNNEFLIQEEKQK